MPRIYTCAILVTQEAIDENGHVGNLEYLRWMQAAAIEHSAAQGWPMARYFCAQAGWVVRSHFIEYLRPAFEGDRLLLHTWVTAMERGRSPRGYLLCREGDGALLARAETQWAYVDFRSGRPRPIPEELRTSFALLSEEEARSELGID